MEVESLRRWWQTPVLPSALVAIFAIAFGYSRDFGLFLFLLVPLVLLPLILVWGITVFRAFKALDRRRECYLAIAIALAAPALGILMERGRDQVRFLVWAPFHLDLINRNPGQDGVVAKWDTWGGMGWFNASYLARDGADRIMSLDAANAWGRSLELPCEIVGTERVWQTLYVVTTYECEL